jgi:2-oxoisovalerate dehydrogenase E1 component beta subunit
LVVVAPSTPYDAKGMLKAAIRNDNPVMFFEHKKLYRSIKEDVPDTDYTVPLLKAAIRRQGNDLTAISYGYTMQLTLQAAEQMRQEHGVEIEVVDLRTLAPLDGDTFLESVAKTSRAVIIHEDNRTLGIGAEVAAIIAEQAFDCLDAPILRVAAPDVPLLPAAGELERYCLPSVEKIMAAFTQTMAH